MFFVMERTRKVMEELMRRMFSDGMEELIKGLQGFLISLKLDRSTV